MPGHLALVACGAPLAARVHDVTTLAVDRGWLEHFREAAAQPMTSRALRVLDEQLRQLAA